MNTDNEVQPHISAIHLNLVGARNMLISDFKIASTGVGGGSGFSDNLVSLLKEIANIEMQIAVLREMHPELTAKDISKEEETKRVFEKVDKAVQPNESTAIEGEDTHLYKDAKEISRFNVNS